MATPIEPEICKRTGRLLTEWFEYPEYTDQDLRDQAYEKLEIDPKQIEGVNPFVSSEEAHLKKKVLAFVSARKRTVWPNSMTKQEVHHRLNEATKMVNPDNYKFLPDDVRERTGLEINPLWMMECLVRSGTLGPKEQMQGLKELAAYTHSKAPNISHTTSTQLKPEDWLLELAKEEYTVIGSEELPMKQPRQPVERGASPKFEKRTKKKNEETVNLIERNDAALGEMMDADFDDLGWEDDDD